MSFGQMNLWNGIAFSTTILKYGKLFLHNQMTGIDDHPGKRSIGLLNQYPQRCAFLIWYNLCPTGSPKPSLTSVPGQTKPGASTPARGRSPKPTSPVSGTLNYDVPPGGVLNRNLGRGVRPTQRNPDPVQDIKDVNFATLSKRKCRNFLPCSRLDQAGRIQTLQTARKFAFSPIPTKAHEISENYVDDPV